MSMRRCIPIVLPISQCCRAHAQRRTAGRVVDTERRPGGAGIGLERAVTPWSRLPIALEPGGSVGALRPLAIGQVNDAPSAYNAVIDLARMRVGVSLHMP